jgi:hypothetical protein
MTASINLYGSQTPVFPYSARYLQARVVVIINQVTP